MTEIASTYVSATNLQRRHNVVNVIKPSHGKRRFPTFCSP